MIRSAIFGGLAALAVPTVLESVDGGVARFIRNTSMHFEITGIFFRWSWPIFVVVTLFSFILLQITRNR